MRIALVSQQVSPVETPPDSESARHAIRVRGLSAALTRMGHQVAVYTRRDRPGMPSRCQLPGGGRVEHMPVGPPARLGDEQLLKNMPEITADLGARWRKERPDVAHALDWTSGAAALAARRELGTPVVQSFPSLGVAMRRDLAGAIRVPPGRLRLEPAVGRSANAVLASTSAEASDLSYLGVPATSIHVVPCGVNTGLFRPSGPVAKRTQRPRLVAAASPAGRSGLGILFRALARVPGAELVVACELPRAELVTDDAYSRLTDLARRLGIADRVVFACQVRYQALPVLLRSADLFVDTSWYDPSGLATLQAMACGVPVVAAAAGSHLDIVIDGVTGILVPPGRPDLFARRIRRLLADSTLRACYGAAAADRVRARYSWERIGQETTAAYGAARSAA